VDAGGRLGWYTVRTYAAFYGYIRTYYLPLRRGMARRAELVPVAFWTSPWLTAAFLSPGCAGADMVERATLGSSATTFLTATWTHAPDTRTAFHHTHKRPTYLPLPTRLAYPTRLLPPHNTYRLYLYTHAFYAREPAEHRATFRRHNAHLAFYCVTTAPGGRGRPRRCGALRWTTWPSRLRRRRRRWRTLQATLPRRRGAQLAAPPTRTRATTTTALHPSLYSAMAVG